MIITEKMWKNAGRDMVQNNFSGYTVYTSERYTILQFLFESL